MTLLKEVANLRQNPKAVSWQTVDELAYASPGLAEVAEFLNLVCQNNRREDSSEAIRFEGTVLKDCLDRSQDKRILLFQEEGEDSQRAAVLVDLGDGVSLAMEVIDSNKPVARFGKRYLIQEVRRPIQEVRQPLELKTDEWKIALEAISADSHTKTSMAIERNGACRLAYQVVKLSTNINGWNKLGTYVEDSTLEAPGARIVKGISKFAISKSNGASPQNSTSLHITMSESGLQWSGNSPHNQGEDFVLPDFCVRTYNKPSSMVAFKLGQEHFHMKLHHSVSQAKLESLQRQVKAGTISGRETLLALAQLVWASCYATCMTADIWPIVQPS